MGKPTDDDDDDDNDDNDDDDDDRYHNKIEWFSGYHLW